MSWADQAAVQLENKHVLRSFNPMPDGRRRDAVYYGVLKGEWPEVKEQLLTAQP